MSYQHLKSKWCSHRSSGRQKQCTCVTAAAAAATSKWRQGPFEGWQKAHYVQELLAEPFSNSGPSWHRWQGPVSPKRLQTQPSGIHTEAWCYQLPDTHGQLTMEHYKQTLSLNTRSVIPLHCCCCKRLTTAYWWGAWCLKKRGRIQVHKDRLELMSHTKSWSLKDTSDTPPTVVKQKEPQLYQITNVLKTFTPKYMLLRLGQEILIHCWNGIIKP